MPCRRPAIDRYFAVTPAAAAESTRTADCGGGATSTAAAPRPPKPPAPPFTLLGTVVGVDKRVAIFFDKSTRQETRLQEGSEEGGWRLKSVEPRSVVVERDGLIVTIDFPKLASTSVAIVELGNASPVIGAAAEAVVGADDIPNWKPPAPPFTLLGTVVSMDKRVAIFFDKSTRQETRLPEGSEEKGWRLQSVAPGSVVLEKDGSIVTIDFSRSARTSVATVEPGDASMLAGTAAEAQVHADDILNRERVLIPLRAAAQTNDRRMVTLQRLDGWTRA